MPTRPLACLLLLLCGLPAAAEPAGEDEPRVVMVSYETRLMVVRTDFLKEIGVEFDLGDGAAAGGEEMPDLFTFLDDLAVNLLVRATQADRLSLSLTAPRTTTRPGEVARVQVTRQVTVGDDKVANLGERNLQAVVRGVASEDGRSVRLAAVIQALPPAVLGLKEKPEANRERQAAAQTPEGLLEAVGLPDADDPMRMEPVWVLIRASVPDKGTLAVRLPFDPRQFLSEEARRAWEAQEDPPKQEVLLLIMPTLIEVPAENGGE